MKPAAGCLHRIADNLPSGRLPNADDAEAHAAALRRHLKDGTDLLRVVGLPDNLIEYLPSLLNGCSFVANLPLNLESLCGGNPASPYHSYSTPLSCR